MRGRRSLRPIRGQRGAAALVVTMLLVLRDAARRRGRQPQRGRRGRAPRPTSTARPSRSKPPRPASSGRSPGSTTDTPIGDDCLPSADPAAPSFRERYLRDDGDGFRRRHLGRRRHRDAAAGRLRRAAMGLACSCPANGRPGRSPTPDGSATVPVFIVQLRRRRPGPASSASIASGCTPDRRTLRRRPSTRPRGHRAARGRARPGRRAARRAGGGADRGGDARRRRALRSASTTATRLRRHRHPCGRQCRRQRAAPRAARRARRWTARWWPATPSWPRFVRPVLRALLRHGPARLGRAAGGDAHRVRGRLHRRARRRESPPARRLIVVARRRRARRAARARLAGTARSCWLVSGALRLRGDVALHGLVVAGALDWRDAAANAGALVRGAVLVDGGYQRRRRRRHRPRRDGARPAAARHRQLRPRQRQLEGLLSMARSFSPWVDTARRRPVRVAGRLLRPRRRRA